MNFDMQFAEHPAPLNRGDAWLDEALKAVPLPSGFHARLERIVEAVGNAAVCSGRSDFGERIGRESLSPPAKLHPR